MAAPPFPAPRLGQQTLGGASDAESRQQRPHGHDQPCLHGLSRVPVHTLCVCDWPCGLGGMLSSHQPTTGRSFYIYVCMCVCMHMFVHVCIAVCICVHACLCMHGCMHTHVHVCSCMHLCLCVYSRVCACVHWCACGHACVCMHMCMHAVCACMFVCFWVLVCVPLALF